MDNSSTSTMIWLDNSEANQFVLFQKYFIPINLCIERRVFEQKGSSVTLHFNNLGEIVQIIRNDLLYLKNSDFTNTNGLPLS